MTVATNLNRKEYAGNGVTTAFSTNPFVFFEEDDLDVYVVVDATGAATLKTIATHYTVAGGDGATGTVTMLVAPAVGETLVIVRNLDIVQETDLVNNDGSDAEVLEGALDRGAMIMQQIDSKVGRSFRLPDSDVSGASTELPVPEAGTVIGWDEDAEALVNYEATDLDLSLVSTYFGTLIGVGDADELFQEIVDGATAETAPAIGDVILLSDVSLTPDDGRKMTLGNLFKVVSDFTAETLPIASTDYVPLYDASAGSAKKLLLNDIPLPPKFISGLVLSNNSGDANNDVDVSAGSCRDGSDADNMRLVAALTKRIDATWAVGTNQGGLDGTESVAGTPDTSTWYYVWLIKRSDTGVVDALFSESATAPTMPTNYTHKRLIGAVYNNSSGNIDAFHAYETAGGGLRVMWDTYSSDISLSATLGSTARTDAVRAPTGFSTTAHLLARGIDAATWAILVTCPDVPDLAVASDGSVAPYGQLFAGANVGQQDQFDVTTSSAGLIRSRANATIDTYLVSTLGFTMFRR